MLDLVVGLLPLAVLIWARRGKGIFGRGRGQIMAWTSVFFATYAGGLWWGVGAFVALCALGAYTGSKLRITTQLEVAHTQDALDGFRRGTSADALAGTVGGSSVVGVTFPLSTATVTMRAYHLSRGRYLRLERTVLRRNPRDDIWIDSFLPNGVWVSSSDQIHSSWDAMPHESLHMEWLPDVFALVAAHERALGRYDAVPEELGAESYLEKYRHRVSGRMQHCVTTGTMRLVDGAYAYSSKAHLLSIRYAFDFITAALSARAVIGPVARAHLRTNAAATDPDTNAWERVVRSTASPLDAALNILVMLSATAFLGFALKALLTP